MRQHTHNTGHLGYDRNGRANGHVIANICTHATGAANMDRIPSQIMRFPRAIPNSGGIRECGLQMEFTPSFDSVR